MVCEKLRKFWSDLDVTVNVNKRELVLGVAACTLAGAVFGLLCSPRKTVTVGSHNGCNNTVLPEEPAEEPHE